MTIPRQTADTRISHPAPSDSASQAAIDDAHSNYGTTHSFTGDSSIALDAFEPPVLPPLDPAYLASHEQSHSYLLKLDESPRDSFALATLWDENLLSIENEMQRHLH